MVRLCHSFFWGSDRQFLHQSEIWDHIYSLPLQKRNCPPLLSLWRHSGISQVGIRPSDSGIFPKSTGNRGAQLHRVCFGLKIRIREKTRLLRPVQRPPVSLDDRNFNSGIQLDLHDPHALTLFGQNGDCIEPISFPCSSN